ncbi:MAG: hypothetical protein P8L85_21065 [Rubripirellula sp.]|nr:hypothetical protein [Rubripirellula sp.]
MNDDKPEQTGLKTRGELRRSSRWYTIAEFSLLMLLIFAYAGDAPPMVNEAHYLVKAKSFWDPSWCANDLFVASTKAHTTFYAIFGWPTLFVSLSTTAWIGRFVAWSLLAIGLQRLCWTVFERRWLSLIVALVWIAGVEYGNLAGEWVVGGIEAKVPAYGLILFALADMSKRRWNRVWLWLGAASALHVLSGGWSVIAAMVSWAITERKREDRIPLLSGWLFGGGAIALFGLVPAVALTMGTSAEASTAAARIYSYYRIRHHLLPADFLPHWYLRHAVLIVVTWFLARRYVPIETGLRSLAGFTWGAVGIAGIGMIVGLLPAFAPDLAAKLLRYYWFRLTDAVVPLMLAMLVAALIIDRARTWSRIGLACCALALMLVSVSSFDRMRRGVPPSVSNVLLGRDMGASRQVQHQVMKDWIAVCRWARLSSPQDAVFLTPRHQQTFKWYAHRAEVVNWKDVPQDAESLSEWNRRFLEIYPQRLGFVRVTIRYDKLREYRREHGVRAMIVDRRVTGENLPLVRLYPTAGEANATYAVYELPQD